MLAAGSWLAKRCIVFRHRHNRLFFGWQKHEIPPRTSGDDYRRQDGGKI